MNEAKELNNWGKFYKEIQEAKRLKESHIDKAHSHVHVIKKLFDILKLELQDVREMHEYFKKSEVLIRGFNLVYYDHLIDDWVNDSNLVDTLTSTLSASVSISQLKDGLIRVKENATSEYQKLEERKEKLLNQLNS